MIESVIKLPNIGLAGMSELGLVYPGLFYDPDQINVNSALALALPLPHGMSVSFTGDLQDLSPGAIGTDKIILDMATPTQGYWVIDNGTLGGELGFMTTPPGQLMQGRFVGQVLPAVLGSMSIKTAGVIVATWPLLYVAGFPTGAADKCYWNAQILSTTGLGDLSFTLKLWQQSDGTLIYGDGTAYAEAVGIGTWLTAP